MTFHENHLGQDELVEKVKSDLEKLLGVNDSDLAEFVIHLGTSASDPETFSAKLRDNGAQLDPTFVQDLFDTIHRKTCDESSRLPEINDNSPREAFPALSLKDCKVEWEEEHIDKKRRRSSPQRRSEYRQRYRSVSPEPLMSFKDIREGDIYSGQVISIVPFGCFVSLSGFIGKTDGLVHISEIVHGRRVQEVSDFVSKNQRVYVKVLRVKDRKISLTLKSVDQETGEDLSKLVDFNVNKEFNEKRRKKRLTSPERWELSRLQSAGTLNVSQLELLNDEPAQSAAPIDEEFEIELKQAEPSFLRGQTHHSIDLTPIRVSRNPDGSMQRAALNQSELAKERRLLLQQQREENYAESNQDPDGLTEVPQFIHSKRFDTNESKTSLKAQRESLPIFNLREPLLRAIEEHQILIVIGETGSGKSTQITQYLAESGYAGRGKIGCTQPRRVAAISVARRVAEEAGCRIGSKVGYTIRFDDCTSRDTVIKYMTDGMLLRECLMDPELKGYSAIMLDEAHERTVHTDVLFGLLKRCIVKRPDLKLIVTSATLDAEKFSKYFNQCPIFTIPGRTFPVDILYAKKADEDYLNATLLTVQQIHESEPAGDILVFLTGKEEIDTACQFLEDMVKRSGRNAPPLIVLPVYSALSSELQSRIFEPAPPGCRKCVVATNIAEASLTIDGIYYVVDPGYVKQKVFDAKLGMDSLVVTPISQASANQRAGRAGRTGPGKCFRLYTEDQYEEEMLPMTIPEIQRTNLGNTVLLLKALGINDLLGFDFMDPPPAQTLISAMEKLYYLGALDDEGYLTKQGKKMSEFPLDPPLSKMLIASVDFECSEEILTIVAMLSVENVFTRPREKTETADRKRARFFQPEGDHIMLLEVFNAWIRNDRSKMWCNENFIQFRSMRRAEDVRQQLVQLMDRFGLDIVSCGRDYVSVRKSICSGFFIHAAKKDPQEGYKSLVEGLPVYIHPSSSLFHRQPLFCIYHQVVLTSKEYMREVISIDPKWLIEVADEFYRPSDPESRKGRDKIQPLFDKRDKQQSWRLGKRDV